MRIVIVTGMSGAGKTTALKNLEDAGYYCIDNMPIQLSVKFFELATENSDIEKLALGIDIRSGHNIEKLEEVIDALKKANNRVEVLFLESNDEVLVKRYKETRRSHPLAVGKSIGFYKKGGTYNEEDCCPAACPGHDDDLCGCPGRDPGNGHQRILPAL